MAKRNYIERPFEVKSVDATTGIFKGYGSVFGEVDSHRDIVMPGAFSKSLAKYKAKGRLVPMLWQHDTWNPIGVYPELKEDDIGLDLEGECNMEVQQGREAHALMKQRALSGLSIGFNITRADERDPQTGIRKIHEVDLWEISPVTFPSNDSSRVVDVKSIAVLESLADCEKALRDAGFSRAESTALVSRIKSIGVQSDSGNNDVIAADLTKALSILQGI